MQRKHEHRHPYLPYLLLGVLLLADCGKEARQHKLKERERPTWLEVETFCPGWVQLTEAANEKVVSVFFTLDMSPSMLHAIGGHLSVADISDQLWDSGCNILRSQLDRDQDGVMPSHKPSSFRELFRHLAQKKEKLCSLSSCRAERQLPCN